MPRKTRDLDPSVGKIQLLRRGLHRHSSQTTRFSSVDFRKTQSGALIRYSKILIPIFGNQFDSTFQNINSYFSEISLIRYSKILISIFRSQFDSIFQSINFYFQKPVRFGIPRDKFLFSEISVFKSINSYFRGSV